jgi:di/tripeptidase
MPENNESEEVTIKSLEEYYNFLEDLLKNMQNA